SKRRLPARAASEMSLPKPSTVPQAEVAPRVNAPSSTAPATLSTTIQRRIMTPLLATLNPLRGRAFALLYLVVDPRRAAQELCFYARESTRVARHLETRRPQLDTRRPHFDTAGGRLALLEKGLGPAAVVLLLGDRGPGARDLG